MNLLKFSFFTLLIIVCHLTKAQQKPFEGTVYYRHFIEMKDTTKSEWDVIAFYGSESWLSIKNGNYNWQFSNSSLERELYLQKEKKLYNQYLKNDTLYFSSSEVLAEEILEVYPIKKNAGTVLGKSCDLLLVKSKFKGSDEIRGRMYYFSDAYPLDPSMFAHLKTNNQDVIYEKMKAIPLRIVVVHKDYRVIYEANSISEKPVEIKLFEIDDKKPKKKY